jgi:DNA-binding HxlR family transcriptional regulator
VTTRTAAERREEMRAAHRQALAACPTQEVLGRLGDKWAGLVTSCGRRGSL